jgi:hypothetical protein
MLDDSDPSQAVVYCVMLHCAHVLTLTISPHRINLSWNRTIYQLGRSFESIGDLRV